MSEPGDTAGSQQQHSGYAMFREDPSTPECQKARCGGQSRVTFDSPRVNNPIPARQERFSLVSSSHDRSWVGALAMLCPGSPWLLSCVGHVKALFQPGRTPACVALSYGESGSGKEAVYSLPFWNFLWSCSSAHRHLAVTCRMSTALLMNALLIFTFF